MASGSLAQASSALSYKDFSLLASGMQKTGEMEGKSSQKAYKIYQKSLGLILAVFIPFSCHYNRAETTVPLVSLEFSKKVVKYLL